MPPRLLVVGKRDVCMQHVGSDKSIRVQFDLPLRMQLLQCLGLHSATCFICVCLSVSV
jgi:hypothetical protein